MDVSKAMIACYDEPEMVHVVLQKATSFLIEYCRAYKAVGAHGVVIAGRLRGCFPQRLRMNFVSLCPENCAGGPG
jgi:uroporphyrinogen decarboxylase